MPLTGLELRGCWEAATPGGTGAPADADRRLVAVGPGRRDGRGFVPIDEDELVAVSPGSSADPVAGRDDGPGPTLFGEPER